MRVVICDDSPVFLDSTAQHVRRWAEENSTTVSIHTYDNGDALLDCCAAEEPDIIFMDILMPLLGGIEAAKEIRRQNKTVHIIFLTSSADFALESYDAKAQGYLLKPVEYDRIKSCLDDCAEAHKQARDHLTIKTAMGYQTLYFRDIEYAEAQNKHVVFCLKSGDIVETTEPLYTIEKKIAGYSGFFHCHRSYIVYLPNIHRFNHTEITTKSGKTIPVARGYAKTLKEAYFAVMFGEE